MINRLLLWNKAIYIQIRYHIQLVVCEIRTLLILGLWFFVLRLIAEWVFKYTTYITQGFKNCCTTFWKDMLSRKRFLWTHLYLFVWHENYTSFTLPETNQKHTNQTTKRRNPDSQARELTTWLGLSANFLICIACKFCFENIKKSFIPTPHYAGLLRN